MKKIFLIAFVLSLVISALFLIFILLFGKTDDLMFKVLLTVLSADGYSLTALASAALREKYRDSFLALVGVICSVAGFILINCLIWGSFLGSEMIIWKSALVLMILSIALAHTCLLLHIKPEASLVRWSLFGTILSISFTALMLILLVVDEGIHIDSNYLRFLGVVVTLDVLGTITTSILNKVHRNK